MEHYVCTGGCGGVAAAPGVCQAKDCAQKGLPLEVCSCPSAENHANHRESPTADTRMKKAVIVLILAAAAIITGFWWWGKEEAAITSEAPDTANWLTYRNEKYGFEFKYPANIKLTEEKREIKFLTERGEGFYITATLKIHSDISEFKWTNIFRRNDYFSFDPVSGRGSWQKSNDDSPALTSELRNLTAEGVSYYRQAEGDAGGFVVTFLLPIMETDIVLEFRISGEEYMPLPEPVLQRARDRIEGYTDMIETIIKMVRPA